MLSTTPLAPPPPLSTVKKALRPVHKYASKFTATVLDELIDDALRIAKHPQAVSFSFSFYFVIQFNRVSAFIVCSLQTQKWLSKMRASILKRVSQSSRVLYYSTAHDPAWLDEQIARTEEAIRLQTLQLHDVAIASIQQNKLTTLPSLG
jgi:hypothetical protein